MILSIGEALIDKKGNQEFFGGGPLNVALTMARLDTPVSFIGGISSDNYGNKILNYLIDNCILFDSSFCSRTEPTPTAGVTVVDGKEQYFFNWKGTAGCYLDADKMEDSYKLNCDINALFFGSLTYTIEKNSKILDEFIQKHSNLFSFFDPNIRPKAIDDFKEYKQRVFNTCKLVDIVKLSEDDLSLLEINEGELFERCKHHLVVTRGSKGATWYSKDLGFSNPVSVDGISVPVVDTIGCGDCFSGAVLHWLDSNNMLNNTLRLSETDLYQLLFFAVSVSAMNATREGCNPPKLEEMV